MQRGGIIQMLASTAIMALLLFGSAGTLAWPQGWGLIALFDACSIVLGLWLHRYDPALLAERMASPLAGDQRRRDRIVMVAILVVFAVWLVLMGLDARRFTWSHVPPVLQLTGAALIVAAFGGWADVLRVNSFASTRIKLQSERRQTVISTGPYAVVRHPMYAWVVPLVAGTALLLGSYWGLLGVPAILPLLDARARGEEAMLSDGLPGYRAYMARVRRRFIPFVW